MFTAMVCASNWCEFFYMCCVGARVWEVVVGMMVGAGREVAGKEERAVDITDISDKQTEIDNDIKTKWGNPSTSQLTLLSGTIVPSDINENTGDYWYYLNSDITANYSSATSKATGNVRIVLNGYSLSGRVAFSALNANATVSIFDKIPGKSGTGYNYNSNAVKYYKYNSGTGGYTDYSTTVPSGTDVTDMPTWKANTYIKVTGSAFSPNALNTNLESFVLYTSHGKHNVYGINVVGREGSGSIFAVQNNGNGELNMYACNVIANKAAGWGAIGNDGGTIKLVGCNVYGNQDLRSRKGIQPSDTNIPNCESDLIFTTNTRGTISLYKCNVGAITDGVNNHMSKAVYAKDVDFGNETVTIATDTIPTFFVGTNGISGTIELVYNCTTNYTGTSQNLNFIVHGNDSDSDPRKGNNNLTISGTCGNITTVFDDTTVVKPITINGTCSGISTRGNVTIGSNGNATIPTGKSVGGTVTNNGTLNLEGTVSNLTNNSIVNITSSGAVFTSVINNGNIVIPQGKSYTISSGQTLGGMLTNQGTLTIDSGSTVTSPIENAGTLNVSGTVSDVYGYGGINVNTNGNVEKVDKKRNLRYNTVMLKFQYTIQYQNRKTVTIQIQEGAVFVKAPFGCTKEKIEQFLQEKSSWILQKLQNHRENVAAFLEIREKRKILYRGKEYPIFLNAEKNAFENGNFYFKAERNIQPFFIKNSFLSIQKFLLKVASTMHVQYSSLKLINFKAKWGSCDSKQNIKLNWRACMLPDEVLYYLMVHELAHTVEMNHSTQFWFLVEKYCKAYKALRKQLKSYDFLTNFYR